KGCAWVRDHVADVSHTCSEQYQALKSESESAVYAGTKSAGIEIPPELLFVNIQSLHFLLQHVQALFPLRTSNYLSNPGEKNVHGTHGLSVLVQAHIECLDVGRIIEK